MLLIIIFLAKTEQQILILENLIRQESVRVTQYYQWQTWLAFPDPLPYPGRQAGGWGVLKSRTYHAVLTQKMLSWFYFKIIWQIGLSNLNYKRLQFSPNNNNKTGKLTCFIVFATSLETVLFAQSTLVPLLDQKTPERASQLHQLKKQKKDLFPLYTVYSGPLSLFVTLPKINIK